MRKKILALDFDGVIANNVREYVILSLATYRKAGGKIKNTKKAVKILRANRPYVKNAGDSFLILTLSEEGKRVNLKEIKKNSVRFKNEMKEFREEFFRLRKKLMKNKKKWLSLYKIFRQIKKPLIKISKSHGIFVATTRDRNSAYCIIRRFGIPIKKGNVISREISEDKAEQMRHICKKVGCRPSDILFLDDSIENLKAVRKIGTKTAMASWGFVLPEQITEAKRIGIPVIKQNGFGKRIRKLL